MIPLEIFDVIRRLSNDVQSTAGVVAIAVAVILILVTAVKTRFSIVPILVVALAAGLVLWIIANVMDVQDWVGSELEESSSPSVVSTRSTDSGRG